MKTELLMLLICNFIHQGSIQCPTYTVWSSLVQRPCEGNGLDGDDRLCYFYDICISLSMLRILKGHVKGTRTWVLLNFFGPKTTDTHSFWMSFVRSWLR